MTGTRSATPAGPTDQQGTLEATARWTAAVRALESARDDRLIEDPWASELAGPEGSAWLAERSPESVLPIVLRTRYFDDWLLASVREVTVPQVVLLGAGLDTRAFRLAWPDATVVFELDRPAVLAHKSAVLSAAGAAPRCRRELVAADLGHDWPRLLLDAGFRPSEPSVWLLEGLLFYLPVDRIATILDDVTGLAAARSRLGFDIVNAEVLTSPWTRAWVEMQAAAGAPWLGTMEDPVGYLAGHGWRASLTQAGQPDAAHGRWTLPVIPTTMPGMPHSWFITAERRP
jgi:methyltransferase (TIGR00027 family)